MTACGGLTKSQKADEELGLDPEGSPAELYVKMAEEYYARGQTEVAFRRAQQAIDADDKYPRAHIWLAFLLAELGQADKAREHYDRAIALAPKNSDVLYAYGSFQCRHKLYAEADANFRKALDNPLYSTRWIAMTSAGDCAASAGDSAKAEGYYQSAIAANPTFGPALAKLAELAYKRGDAKTAKDYVDRYFKPETARTASTSYSVLKVGAAVERKLGNRKQADYYETVLKSNFPVAPTIEAPTTRDL